jgi:hypothetical protein
MLTTISSLSSNLEPQHQEVPVAQPALTKPIIEPMEFWAFLENSDFMRSNDNGLYRMDEVSLIRHDEFLDTDYQLLADIGCKGVRDAARWLLTNPSPGVYDWTWMDRIVDAADRYRLHQYLDLWHYGYPNWLDILSPDAVTQFAHYARSIALRYPMLKYYCVCNEPSLLLELGGRQGQWAPFLRHDDAGEFRRQICRMIIEASKAILDVNPDAILVLPEPWHATNLNPEDNQAAVIDTVLGLRDTDLGGRDDLITVIGLNHYRDSTLPPLHCLIRNAQQRWPHKSLWLTETSGPPVGWAQTEWFWWMMAEVRLAIMAGVKIPVFTWAPAISMYDWIDETVQLANGIWTIQDDGSRLPNGHMVDAIQLARSYNYLR